MRNNRKRGKSKCECKKQRQFLKTAKHMKQWKDKRLKDLRFESVRVTRSIKDLRTLLEFMISQISWKHLHPLTAARKYRTLGQHKMDLQWRQ